MLQLPETQTAEIPPVASSETAELLPTDIRSLIALLKETDAAVERSMTDEEMEPYCRRAERIYRALVKVTPPTLQEEAERLTFILEYLKTFGAADGQIDGGWLDLPELTHIAKNLTKLARPVGPAALKVIDKKIQPLAKSPAPNLKTELDRLAGANDISGMIALYEYFSRFAKTSHDVANRPNAETVGDFLDADSVHLWAKAYAVADRLKSLTPPWWLRERHAETLYSAALQMGATLAEATAVARYLNEQGGSRCVIPMSLPKDIGLDGRGPAVAPGKPRPSHSRGQP